MSHLPDPTEHLDREPQKIYDKICAKRGGHHWPGLFPVLMNYPALAEKFSDWSAFLRFDAELKPLFREFTILCLAAHLRSAYEFETHLSYAKAAGVPDHVISQLAERNFKAISDPIYVDINKAIEILLNLKVMPQALHDSLVEKLGLHGFIQLSILIGWYRMIASLDSAFEFTLPEGMKVSWPMPD